jgi:hypothetical protein
MVKQQDVFYAAQDVQLTSIQTLQRETETKIEYQHGITRREIVEELKVRLRSIYLVRC